MEEKGDRQAPDTVSYLNMKGVLTGRLMIKVLGAFCLSISHQVFGKVIKETAGKAGVWGLFELRRQEPCQECDPHCAASIASLWPSGAEPSPPSTLKSISWPTW